jgi:hypothetical protein
MESLERTTQRYTGLESFLSILDAHDHQTRWTGAQMSGSAKEVVAPEAWGTLAWTRRATAWIVLALAFAIVGHRS